MTQPAKSQEPSMEEILASIRRIIADDDIAKPAAVKPEQAISPQSSKPVAAAPKPAPIAEMPAPQHVEVAQEPEPNISEPPLSEDANDILELTDDMRAPEPEVYSSRSFRTIDGQPDIVFAESQTEPLPPARHAYPEPVAQMPDPLEVARRTLAESMDRPLLSNSASVAVDSAFSSLAHTVLTQNARTLDDLVKDMLRPMLKSWLDDNLPGLVERLVRAEIERVSRGR